MKNNLKSLVLLVLGLILFQSQLFAQDPNFHIYLCIGQSNMEGQGPLESADQQGFDATRFRVFGAVNCSGNGHTYSIGTQTAASAQLFRCNTKVSLVENFGKVYLAGVSSSVKVGVVPVAIAGCSIDLFDKAKYQSYASSAASWMQSIINEYGGNPYSRLITVAKEAQKVGVIKGILFHQGETNSGDNNWPNNVKKVYTDILTDLGLTAANCPILVGEMLSPGQCSGHNTIIAKMPSTIPTSYVISSANCTGQSDNLHFTSAGYRTMGQRYAEKMLSLLGPSCTTAAPIVTTPITLTQGATATALTATGTALKWYTVATGGTALTSTPVPGTSTVGSTTYYVSQTLNSCEGPRAAIVVNVTSNCATTAPTVTSPVLYDLGATASPLSATGTALKWYTVATGGTASTIAPTPSTATVGTTTYYVSQTLNNCEGPRATIVVNVINNFKIYSVSTAPVMDGAIDGIWTNASVISAGASKLLSGTVTNTTDLSGSFKALWDNTYLYVLADVTDDVKVNDSQNSYDDDAVEVYIDINNDKATSYGTNDFQYTFGWNDGTTVGVLPSGRSTTGITYSAVARTGGYIVEARIPWSTLQGTPAVGQAIGIDFMINDDDDNGTRDGKLSWNAATDNAWQDPSLFGTANLVNLIVTELEEENVGSDASGIVCYPNPFTNDFTIKVKGDFDYVVITTSGEIIYSGVGNSQIQLGKELSEGMYFLKIKQSESSKVTKICKK